MAKSSKQWKIGSYQEKRYLPKYTYPKYWDTKTPYHNSPKIWTKPFTIDLLIYLNPGRVANSVDPEKTDLFAQACLSKYLW